MRLRGLAAVFNRASEPELGFVESIAPGAFDGADLSDCICVYNHDKNFLLGRTSSKTLEVKADARGLRYTVELPETEQARSIYESVRRGDVEGSSFSFKIARDVWSYDEDADLVRRVITKFERVFDTSPVVAPAYKATTCEAVA